MPVENTLTNGFREISAGLIVCNSCGKIHQIQSANRKPLKCESCSERFVNAPSAADVIAELSKEEIVHYEVDCPQCNTHYEIDLQSGPVIFDCGECGCSFTVEEETGFRKSGSRIKAAEAVVEVPSGRSKKRRTPMRAALSISKHKSKHPWLNSFLTFLVATIVCIGFVIYLILQAFEERENSASRLQDATVSEPAVDEVAGEREDIFTISILSEREAGAFLKALEGFVGAPTLEDKLTLCRFPGVAGMRMQDFYQSALYSMASLVAQERVGPVQLVEVASGQKFVQARFRDKNGTESVYVGEIMAGGQFAFEWEPTVQFTEVPWNEVEAGLVDRPVTAMVRILKSTRYTGELSMDKYASYQVYRKSIGDGFVAYAELGSEAEKKLSEVFAVDKFPLLGLDGRSYTKHVMLKFEFPKEWNVEGGSRYGRIVEVVQEDWVRYGK